MLVSKFTGYGRACNTFAKRFNSAADTEQGFTLIELVVVMVIVSIIIGAFMGVMVNYFDTITQEDDSTSMTSIAQNLLRVTVNNLRLGDGVRQSNQITDPNGPSGGWSTSDVNFVIILAVPAVNSSHAYIIDPDTGSPYMNELVYYKNGSTLMERRLANPNATGNTIQTTCPPSMATSTCPADIHLADYVHSIVFTLYDQNANSTTVPANARSVNITLVMQRTSFGHLLSQTTSMRVTLRNWF